MPQNSRNSNVVYAEVQDLYSHIPLTVMILIARYLLKKHCFTSLGRWLQIPDVKRKPAAQNAVLEVAYFHQSTPPKHLASLAKQVDMTERQVERWWHLRRRQDKPSKHVKFCENMWTLTFNLFNFLFGFYVLWDKEWFWDFDHIYTNYQHQGITSDIWWYYMISSAFYWSLVITQFWDVRRKDFWQMFVHHIATIALLSFSWVCNLHRAGSVVLFLHDSSGFLVDFGKVAKCAGFRGIGAIFAVFVVVWIVTRLVLFPFYILGTAAPCLVTSDLRIYIMGFNSLLLVLLNLIWTKMIFKVIYNSVTTGKEPEDLRSSCSNSDSEELENEKLKKK